MSELYFNWTQMKNAPSSGQKVCDLSSLTEGQIKEVIFGELKEPFKMIVFLKNEVVYGYVNKCPHHWLNLQRPSDGVFMMWSEDEVMCGHHSSVFDLTNSGRCTDGVCSGTNLPNIPLFINNDNEILISDE